MLEPSLENYFVSAFYSPAPNEIPFFKIFEFKSVDNADRLEAAAVAGLKQIDEKRYYAGAPKNKPLIKTAIAFCGKRCRVKSGRHNETTLQAMRDAENSVNLRKFNNADDMFKELGI